MAAAEGRAFARAALAGNPSDGYGGATLAVTVRNFAATVRAETAPVASIEPASELVSAAAKRVPGGPHPPAAIRWATTIPREVGLAGSSALIVATIRALCSLRRVALPADAVAALALTVEVEDLGIAAGPQDRVAQAHEGLLNMDFAGADLLAGRHGTYEPLDPSLLPPLYLAYATDAASPSGAVHTDLGERFARGEADVVAGMGELAQLARWARDALKRGDLHAFGRCVDASFDARRSLVALDRRHVEMVELARATGASANFAGSGGAVVGSCRDDLHRGELAAAFRRIGCTVVEPRVA